MKKINRNTKKAKQFIEAYINSNIYTLDDCYNSYSKAKSEIFNECENKARKDSAVLKIISYNCNFFSAAWHTSEGLRIETPANSYLIPDVTD